MDVWIFYWVVTPGQHGKSTLTNRLEIYSFCPRIWSGFRFTFSSSFSFSYHCARSTSSSVTVVHAIGPYRRRNTSSYGNKQKCLTLKSQPVVLNFSAGLPSHGRDRFDRLAVPNVLVHIQKEYYLAAREGRQKIYIQYL